MSPAARTFSLSDPAWSKELTVAASVYGTAAQMQVIRYLRFAGPSGRNEIADKTGLNYGLTSQCLNKLKSAGVVNVSGATIQKASPNDGSAQTRTYALQSARAQALFDALARYLNEPSPWEVLQSGLAGQDPT